MSRGFSSNRFYDDDDGMFYMMSPKTMYVAYGGRNKQGVVCHGTVNSL